MKRKLSLLLAAVMTVSALPFTATEVQASSTNAVRAIPGTTVPANTIFVETDAAASYGLPGMLSSVVAGAADGVPYGMRAGWLEIQLNNNVVAGDASFRLELENAEWFFRSTNIGQDIPVMSSPAAIRNTVLNSASSAWSGNIAADDLDNILTSGEHADRLWDWTTAGGVSTPSARPPVAAIVPMSGAITPGGTLLDNMRQVLSAGEAASFNRTENPFTTQFWPRGTHRLGSGVQRTGNTFVTTGPDPSIDDPALRTALTPPIPDANAFPSYNISLWSPLLPAPAVGSFNSALHWFTAGAYSEYAITPGVGNDMYTAGVGERNPIAARNLAAGAVNNLGSNDDWIYPVWALGGVQAGRSGERNINLRDTRTWSDFAQIHNTYDMARGIFVPGVSDSTGTYLRYGWATPVRELGIIRMNGRPGTSSPEDPWEEVPYVMQVSIMDPRVATVSILDHVTTARRTAGQNIIRVPLVIRATASEDIRVSVIPQGNVAFVTASTHLIAAAGGTNTAAHVEDPVTARDRFEIPRLHIRELRTNSIRHGNFTGGQNRRDNAFDLVLPNGFYFEDTLDTITIGLERGMTWRRPGNTVAGQPANGVPVKGPGQWDDLPTLNPAVPTAAQQAPDRGVDEAGLGRNLAGATARQAIGGNFQIEANSNNNFNGLGQGDYNIFWPDGHQQTRDRLRIRLNAFNESANIAGAIWVDGLVIRAEENAPFDVDIEMRLENTDSLTSSPTWGDGMHARHRNTQNMITPQTIKAGTRRDWGVVLRTEGNVPELISGRYESITSIAHNDHRAATVVFEEVVSNSWWAGRQVVLSLPEEVKWRMIHTVDVVEVTPNAINEDRRYANVNPAGLPTGTTTLQGGVLPVGGGAGVVRDGVRFDGNQMFWNDVLATRIVPNTANNRNDRALIRFNSWISIAAPFEGDVTLTASGSAVPEEVYETLPSVIIATAVPPVRVETVVTDSRIGYQFQETADIIITETRAGALLRDRQVRITVTDFMSTWDVIFSPNTTIEVTDANGLTIRNIGTGLNGSVLQDINFLGTAATPALGVGNTEGSLSFYIGNISSNNPATITVSNVSIRVDRTVPETNERPYEVVVWGSAIANNFGATNALGNIPAFANAPQWERTMNDRFANHPGIVTDYIRVVTGGSGSGWLSQEVRLTIGENYYSVNGVQYDMDAAAYISPTSESTMVPLRFLSNALGIPDRDINWDNSTRTVTITLPSEVGRVVQFNVDSPVMLDNGVPRTIESAHVPPRPINPEIMNERVYLPFRFIGEAIFQVNVDWDAATQTAIFNPGAHTAN